MKRARSCSPRRASRGNVARTNNIVSPGGARSGYPDAAPLGLSEHLCGHVAHGWLAMGYMTALLSKLANAPRGEHGSARARSRIRRQTNDLFSLAPLGERGDRKAGGEGVFTKTHASCRSRKNKSKHKMQKAKVRTKTSGIVSVGPEILDPLTRPAPAGECAGCGPPSPPRGRGNCLSSISE